MDNLPTCRVLIFEDEPLIAIELAQALAERGVQHAIAISLERAQQLLSESEFDGAILDASSIHNLQSQRICEELAKRSIPFVIYSGSPYNSPDAVALVNKPATSMQVLQPLVAAISLRSRQEPYKGA